MNCCVWVWAFKYVNSLKDVHKNKKDYQRFRKDELQVKLLNVRKRLLYGDITRIFRLRKSEN